MFLSVSRLRPNTWHEPVEDKTVYHSWGGDSNKFILTPKRDFTRRILYYWYLRPLETSPVSDHPGSLIESN